MSCPFCGHHEALITHLVPGSITEYQCKSCRKRAMSEAWGADVCEDKLRSLASRMMKRVKPRPPGATCPNINDLIRMLAPEHAESGAVLLEQLRESNTQLRAHAGAVESALKRYAHEVERLSRE